MAEKKEKEAPYSLLSQYHQQAAQTEKKTAEVIQKAPLGIKARIGQTVAAVFVTQIFALGFYLVTINVLRIVYRLDLDKFHGEHPWTFLAVVGGLQLLCVLLGTMLGLRDVYLAQLVGIPVGVLAMLLFYGQRFYFGYPPMLFEWFVGPILGAGVGFLAGLPAGGVHKDEEEEKRVNLQPIDAWDRDSKPKMVEVEPPPTERWLRLFYGSIIGCLAPMSVQLGYHVLVLVFGSPDQVELILRENYYYMGLASLFAGGVMAGSGTKNGISQGLLVGLIIFGCNLAVGRLIGETVTSMLMICLFLPVVGSLLGRYIFGPKKLFGGPELDNRRGNPNPTP